MVVAFAGARLLMTQVLSNDTVSGDSMQPTLNDKNRLISIRHHSIKRNDIVVLNAPDVAGELYIKRVIGMPGDTVAVKNEKLYVNGKLTPQPYLKTSFMRNEITAWGKATIRTPQAFSSLLISISKLTSRRNPHGSLKASTS